jgi:hypothetical protein
VLPPLGQEVKRWNAKASGTDDTVPSCYDPMYQGVSHMAKTKTKPAGKTGDNGIKKTECPFTSREEFMQEAEPVKVTIELADGTRQSFMVPPKDGSLLAGKSLGYYLNDSVKGEMGKTRRRPVKLQIGLNLSVVNSRDLPGISE